MNKILIYIIGILLYGCAAESGWTPTVDTYQQPVYQQPGYQQGYQQNIPPPPPGSPPPPPQQYNPQVQQGYNPNALNQSMVECRQLAMQASGGTASNVAEDAVGGALLGAAGGAIVGAFTGNPGLGAGIGAAAGGFGGGTYGGLSSNEIYKRSYSSCLRQRGFNVLN